MHDVRLGPRALDDLQAIHDYVEASAGDATADAYDGRIRKACARLADFPDKGTPRDDLSPGLRSIAFERRAVIVYIVEGRIVRILRILHGGRQG